MTLAAIVDWAALGQVVLYAFAAALLLTSLYTTGVLLVTADDGAVSGPRRAAGVAAFALCLALVAVGLYVMFTQK